MISINNLIFGIIALLTSSLKASLFPSLIEYLYDKAQAQNHSLGTHTQIYYKKNLIKKS